MKILVVGSGGRGHAFCWKLSQSPLVQKIYAAPGNAGTLSVPKTENIPIAITEILLLRTFAEAEHIDITLVGSEKPIALGIANCFQESGLAIFAPTKEAARIETSKAFSQRFFERHGIPIAPSLGTFRIYSYARDAVSRHYENNQEPLVIKADGLAEGKGTFVCHNWAEADSALRVLMLDAKYGEAGKCVIIQNYLAGREVSLHAFTDGCASIPLICAHDYKSLFAADSETKKPAGPNTGGIGAYAPVPWIDFQEELRMHEIFTESILDGLRREDRPFSGVLYPGIMIEKNGRSASLECNARMGDPEAQTILPNMQSDFAELIYFYKEKILDRAYIQWKSGYSVCVVLASEGYPAAPKNIGSPIYGLEEAKKIPDVLVFHASTQYDKGQLVTAGGRVLNVVASGQTLREAALKAYEAVKHIAFEGMYYRCDIGLDLEESHPHL